MADRLDSAGLQADGLVLYFVFVFFFLTDWFRGERSVFVRSYRREDNKRIRGNELSDDTYIHTHTNKQTNTLHTFSSSSERHFMDTKMQLLHIVYKVFIPSGR